MTLRRAARVVRVLRRRDFIGLAIEALDALPSLSGNAKAGYIYALSNKSIPGGILKVGRSNDPHRRAGELQVTGVPGAYVIEILVATPDAARDEARVHAALTAHRVGDRRANGDMPETFAVGVPTAAAIIKSALKLSDDQIWIKG